MFIENIIYIYSLVIIIPLIYLMYFYSNRKRKLMINLFSTSTISLDKTFYILKLTLITFVFIFSIIALSKPKYGYKIEKLSSSKSDILIALDISDSMLADDVKPNRLERAKREISDFLEILSGERVGLIIFSGISFLQCPFTSDYSALKMFLDYVDTDLISIKGTSFLNLFDKALKTFKEGKEEKYMIIISDGEDNQQDFESYISKFKEKNIKIFSIGVGEELGSPIRLSDGSLKRDKKGNIVITKLQKKNLELISNNTNGYFIKSDFTDNDVKNIYFKGIKKQQESNNQSYYDKKIWNEIFQYFIALSLLFLIIEFLVSNKDEQNRITI